MAMSFPRGRAGVCLALVAALVGVGVAAGCRDWNRKNQPVSQQMRQDFKHGTERSRKQLDRQQRLLGGLESTKRNRK
jgi:hypothetical protein